MINTFDGKTLIILIAAAIVSLVVGICEDPSTTYIEEVAIISAVLIVSVVTACDDYQKETQFRELSKANDDINVLVIRDGRIQQINVRVRVSDFNKRRAKADFGNVGGSRLFPFSSHKKRMSGHCRYHSYHSYSCFELMLVVFLE